MTYLDSNDICNIYQIKDLRNILLYNSNNKYII